MKIRMLQHMLISLVMIGTFACGGSQQSGNGKQQEPQQEQHEHGKHHNHEEQSSSGSGGDKHESAYICPMECEGSASDEAGKCPECGMDLVKREELNKKQ